MQITRVTVDRDFLNFLVHRSASLCVYGVTPRMVNIDEWRVSNMSPPSDLAKETGRWESKTREPQSRTRSLQVLSLRIAAAAIGMTALSANAEPLPGDSGRVGYSGSSQRVGNVQDFDIPLDDPPLWIDLTCKGRRWGKRDRSARRRRLL